MTVRLYDENSYLKEFTATVLDSYPKADGFFTVLDRTAFFPEGGGQAADTGFLNGVRVYDVQLSDGVIYHYTAKQLEKGAAVTGVVDFYRRFDFMQQHSAEHIVSGIAHSLYGCENVGFHLGADIVTLDFDKFLNQTELLEIEQRANEKIFQNVAFRCYYPSEEELSTLQYRSKKELEGDIRIVEIEGTDMCACCAPHVKTAGEIGLLKLLDSEKWKGGIRIQLKAGSRALADYNQKYENVKKISALLATAQHDTAEGVERLLKSLGELKSENNMLKSEGFKYKAQGFEPKADITAVFEENLSIKDLQTYADLLFKGHGGIRGVFSKNENGFAFAICGGDGLDEFFALLKAEFPLKGGGRNGMVQGSLSATKEQIEQFFKK